METSQGHVVILGGAEARTEAVGRAILSLASGIRVAVVPLAAAFEAPEAAVVAAAQWLSGLGAEVEGVMAMSRTEADLDELAGRLRDADIVLVIDGSAMHLRTALRSTALLAEIEALKVRGGVVVAEGSSATVLCDPMVDPRGGAPTVGLGLLSGMTVLSHIAGESPETAADKLVRTAELVPQDLPVLSVAPDAALAINPEGHLARVGEGIISVIVGGEAVELSELTLP